MANFFDWLETRQATAIFGVISLASGFVFLNQGITGNVIFNSEHSLNLLNVVGLMLVFCAVILGVYSIKSGK